MRIRCCLLVCVSTLTLAACSSDTSNTSTKSTTLVPDQPDAASDGGMADACITTLWTQVYTTVIATRCTPCHTTPGGIGITQGMLDMTSLQAAYTNLVNAPAAGVACGGKGIRVVPGQPRSSIMFLKVSLVDPAPCGSKMPFGLPPLAQPEADMIERWIAEGAINN